MIFNVKKVILDIIIDLIKLLKMDIICFNSFLNQKQIILIKPKKGLFL